MAKEEKLTPQVAERKYKKHIRQSKKKKRCEVKTMKY